MIRAQSAYQRVVTSAKTGGGSAGHEGDYCVGDCRYANVLQMIRDGASDEEITDRYPEFKNNPDVLTVYRKIVDGILSSGNGFSPRFNYDAGKHAEQSSRRNGEGVNTTFVKRLEGIGDAYIRVVINALQGSDIFFRRTEQ